MEIGVDDITSLAEKLETLELNEREAAVLDAVLARAADDEVGGFGITNNFEKVAGFKVEIEGVKTTNVTGKSGSGTPRGKKAALLFDAFRL